MMGRKIILSGKEKDAASGILQAVLFQSVALAFICQGQVLWK